MQITYSTDQEYLETNTKTNVVLAAFTTTWARLRLYEAMSVLGKRLLYFDTGKKRQISFLIYLEINLSISDSVIYVSRSGRQLFPTGANLGALSSELPSDDYITEIVCLAPKCYAYVTSKGKTVVKIKGFTINGQTKKELNFPTLLRLLRDPTDTETIHYPFNIRKNKKEMQLNVVALSKRLRFVYDKRRVLYPSLETLPFGYCSV